MKQVRIDVISIDRQIQFINRVQLFATPWTVACQAPLSMEFSRQEYYISSVQSLNCVRFFATPWTAACQAFLPITNSQRLLKLVSVESKMPSNYHILCCPLLLPPSIFPSIRIFSNQSVLCIRWPKYQSFSFSISPSNEYSGLISFRMDWLDLLAVQGTLKSLLQHHSSKSSIIHGSLSNFTLTFHFQALEKEMATHSSILAWRIPGTEEPSGLPSMGSHRVGHY